MLGGSDKAIRDSFAKVKEDFGEQDKKISELRKELDTLKNQVVEYLPRLLEQNNQILRRMEVLEKAILKQPDPLKEQLLSKYKKGRREIVKDRILTLSREKEPSLAQLRDTVVMEQRLCSRATFYRYLSELQASGTLAVVSVNGLERIKTLSQTPSQ